MNIQRTITILIEADHDLERTIEVFREVQQALSEPCYNDGKPLGALALQRECYHAVKGTLSAQMTISAIRTVAGAYQSAKTNKKPATHPFLFKKVWAPPNAVLVFEDLHIPQPEKGKMRGKALRRRMFLWQRGLIRDCALSKAQEHGMSLASVDPRYTNKNCPRCGLRGKRHRHDFSCPHCGYTQHADINAALNIRNRYTISRNGGDSSVSPEAQSGHGCGQAVAL